MREDIRRSALRAAAKLAFSATVFGCGASAGEPAADTTAAETTASPARSEAPSKHDEQCCKEIVDDAFPEGGVASFPAPQVSQEVKNCCEVLAKAADARVAAGEPGAFMWPERSECCSVLGWKGSMTCTPWGPAVPPAMPWVA